MRFRDLDERFLRGLAAWMLPDRPAPSHFSDYRAIRGWPTAYRGFLNIVGWRAAQHQMKAVNLFAPMQTASFALVGYLRLKPQNDMRSAN